MEKPERPIRRHVRLRCLIRNADNEMVGHSSNLSTGGIYVRVRKTQEIAQIATGTAVGIRFLLPNHIDPVSATGDVRWINTNDRDVGGSAAVGIGIQLAKLSPDAAERLESFVQEFRYTILVVEDDSDKSNQIITTLEKDYHVLGAQSIREAVELLESHDVSVLLVEERTKSISGLELLRRVSNQFPHAHFIRVIMSGGPPGEQLEELINFGKVFHYLPNPFRPQELIEVVRWAVDSYALTVENERLAAELERANERLRRENSYLRQRVAGDKKFEHIIGSSPELRKALAEVEQVRSYDATVHIQGETGTGKELVARALHANGPRAKGPFVAQNCGGMTESLLESTLFGHVKGAFTGADRNQPGVFQAANGGTLFLDEVAELPISVQSALLRALQEKEVVPVGSSRATRVDLRIVSATHKDLREEVRHGRFREDLYFRLVVIAIRLPALRERMGDIPILARHFLDLYCERYGKDVRGFDFQAMRALERYSWPGNIRELENEVLRLVVLAQDGSRIALDLLSPHIRVPSPNPAAGAAGAAAAPVDGVVIPFGVTYDHAVESLERTLIERALREAGGVVGRAAELLGMERSRLAKLRRRLEIDVEKPRALRGASSQPGHG